MEENNNEISSASAERSQFEENYDGELHGYGWVMDECGHSYWVVAWRRPGQRDRVLAGGMVAGGEQAVQAQIDRVIPNLRTHLDEVLHVHFSTPYEPADCGVPKP